MMFARIFSRYNTILEKHPLQTKCITTGVMYAGGDVIAQACEHYNEHNDKSKSFSLSIFRGFSMNWNRTMVFFIFGNIVSGPSYHYWFDYLNRLPTLLWQLKQINERGKILRAYTFLMSKGIEVKLDITKIPNAAMIGKWQGKAIKIAADQLIFSTLYTGVFFLGIGVLNGGVEKFHAYRGRRYIQKIEEQLMQDYSLTAESVQMLRSHPNIESSEDSEMAIRGDTESSDASSTSALSAIQRILLERKSGSPDIGKLAVTSEDVHRRLLEMSTVASKIRDPTWRDIWQRSFKHMKDVYLETYVIDCLVWPPLQFINFTFIPVRLQFLFVNCANLAWNTFLSLMANVKH